MHGGDDGSAAQSPVDGHGRGLVGRCADARCVRPARNPAAALGERLRGKPGRSAATPSRTKMADPQVWPSTYYTDARWRAAAGRWSASSTPADAGKRYRAHGGGWLPPGRVESRARPAATARKRWTHSLDRPRIELTLNTKLNIMTVQRAQVTSDVRENATLLMLLRAMPLARGYATVINTFVPIAGQMNRVRVFVTGEETLTVPAGAFPVWTLKLILRMAPSPRHGLGKMPPISWCNSPTGATTPLLP